jgi:hypothetical protein
MNTLCIYIYIYIYLYLYLYLYFVCCVYVRVYIYMCVCVCVCVCTYIYTKCVVIQNISATRFSNSVIIPSNIVVVAGFIVVQFINW